MEQDILALKKALFELERDNTLDNKNKVLNNIENIMHICEKIKSSIQKQGETSVVSNIICNNVKCSKINTITFVYKPIRVKNYFEGDYIIKFAEERSQDLKEAKALDAHNEFWVQHKTIKGNIFGSVPKELLDEKSYKSLLSSGWKEAEVDIIDIKNCQEEIKEIISFCESNFNHYILLNEELTNTHLILHYKIV